MLVYSRYALIHETFLLYNNDVIEAIVDMKREVVAMMRVMKYFANPFTTGDVTVTISDHEPRQDGRIASSVLGTSFIAVVFVLLLLSFGQIGISSIQANGIIRVSLLVLSVIGTFSLMMMIRKIFDQLKDEHSIWKAANGNLKFVFLWCFAIGVLIQETMYAILISATKSEAESLTLGNVLLAWNIIVIVFTVLQTVFITLWRRVSFQPTLSFNYGLMFTLLTDAANWCFFTLFESKELFQNHVNFTSFVNSTSNASSSAVEEFIRTLEPYTTPMIIEYHLLAMAFLLSAKSCNQDHSSRYTRLQHVLSLDNDSTGEYEPILNSSEKRKLHGYIQKCPLLVGIVLCAPMIFLEIYIGNNSALETNIPVLTAFQLFQIVNLSLLITHSIKLLSSVAYYSATTTPRENHTNFLLFFSCFGIQMYDIFGGYGVLIAKDKDALVILTVLKHIFSFIATFYQTTLIMKLKNDTCIHFAIRQPNIWFTNNIILLLSFVNFGFWFGDCFFMKHERNLTLSETVAFGAYWNYIVDVLFPVTIFYRFHCGIELFELYNSL